MKYYYSEKQSSWFIKMCHRKRTEVYTPSGWKTYTEMNKEKYTSNFDDAILIHECEGDAEIRLLQC